MNDANTILARSEMEALMLRSRVEKAKICQTISSTLRNFARLITSNFVLALTKMQTLLNSSPLLVTSQRCCIQLQTLQGRYRQWNEHTAIEQAVYNVGYANLTELNLLNHSTI